MNRSRRKVDRPPGVSGSSLEHQAAKHKPNRLSRSYKQSQQTAEELDSPQSQKSEFKTPTRIPRSRVSGGFSAESPHNDSDIQQDIIWDATSPSPQRLGKRGKKHPAGVVDISEIVSRIAPKHGRPKAAEPTLQQWIGDSANIPCTPDVQAPKPKKKSPRPNGVDDLLKLAKQFDFNMFHQDEEEAEDLHQQSLELLSGDILDFENGDPNDVSPPLPGNRQPAVTAAAEVDLDQHMEDDLDFLFDGPTQHVSGDLSQFSSALPSQVKHAPAVSSREASGKPPSHVPTVGVSMTHAKGTSANDGFEDDWENDDFLDDSLVLEMTQNPQNISAPKHCSTQKPPSDIRHGPLRVPAGGGVRFSQSAASKAEKENVRTTFKLESNPKFSVERIATNTNFKSFSDHSSITEDKDSQQSRFPSAETGNQRTWQTSSNTVNHQRTSAATVTHSASSSTVSNIAATTKTTQNFTNRSSPGEAPAVSDIDFLDDDLDCFFSSDPVWDDPADDDLLCEMCDDLENQIQRTENVSNKQTHQRPALQPSNRNQQPANQQPASGRGGAFVQPLTQKQTSGSGRPAGSFASGVPAGARVNTAKDSIRFTQSESASGTTNSRIQSAAAAPSPSAPPPQGNNAKHQFTFKKPNNPVPTVTSTAFVKCSAAEIELKKQQAMERRRQRLQAVQNLRAPT